MDFGKPSVVVKLVLGLPGSLVLQDPARSLGPQKSPGATELTSASSMKLVSSIPWDGLLGVHQESGIMRAAWDHRSCRYLYVLGACLMGAPRESPRLQSRPGAGVLVMSDAPFTLSLPQGGCLSLCRASWARTMWTYLSYAPQYIFS